MEVVSLALARQCKVTEVWRRAWRAALVMHPVHPFEKSCTFALRHRWASSCIAIARRAPETAILCLFTWRNEAILFVASMRRFGYYTWTQNTAWWGAKSFSTPPYSQFGWMEFPFESCFGSLRGIWVASSEGILRLYLEPRNLSLFTLFSVLFQEWIFYE